MTAGGAEARSLNRRLIGWSVLITVLVAQGYAGTYATSNKQEDKNVLYHYSTAVAGAIVYALMFAIVLWIAVRRRDLLALRRPSSSWLAALGLTVLVFIGAEIAIQAMDPFLHAGREQGLVPTDWQPRHAGAYAANWVVVAAIAPFVEELTFRGVGYSLLHERFGKWAAIAATAVLFAASHGLVEALPELITLGVALAWLRWRTGSILPGMLVHAVFNSLALSAVFFHS